jgi:hypothetical protein
MFDTHDSFSLVLSKSILFFLNSSIKSSLLFISSILFSGFIICSFKNPAHIGVFVLFNTQNKVQRVFDFVEKL